ncbi:serine/threonine-protein phosphatase [Fundidesulfovibrio butyratiphilus]
MTRLTAAGITCAGKVRKRNEDCIGMGDFLRQRPMRGPVVLQLGVWEPLACLVADGIGGHAHGETASRLSVSRILTEALSGADEEAVSKILTAANDCLYDLMLANPEFRGMGATVAGIVVHQEKLIGFNVGDSRIYRVRHGYMQLLSTDDTVGFSQASTAERTGLASHVITQSLGGMPERTEVVAHVWSRPLEGSERFLLCTDGLTDMLDQDTMEACLTDDAESTVSALHEQALAQGGHDNVSLVLLDVKLF